MQVETVAFVVQSILLSQRASDSRRGGAAWAGFGGVGSSSVDAC